MTKPYQMQALFIEDHQLVMRTAPLPKPAADEVRIKVAYAGLNRADLFQKQGSYPAPEGAPNIAGLEVSGHIDALGEAVTGWHKNSEVCALLDSGGYAEYVCVKAAHCLPIPKGLSLMQAAALPECTATVWMALMDEAQLKAGERVLVHGGASGVGTTAIQMLRAAGHEVFTTAGSDEKTALCESLGARAINYKQQDFAAIIREAGGVDVILDIVGGDYVERNLQCLRPDGRLVSIALLEGGKAHVNAGRILLKRLRWIGATLRARSDAHKAEYIAQLRQIVWPQIESGAICPVIDSVFALADAEQAQEKMLKYLHCGKILLKVGT